MDISAVSSTVNAQPQAQASARVRQSEQDQQAQQAQQAQQSQQAQREKQVQSASLADKDDSTARSQAVSESRPTVNANGQAVGTRVNTTA